MKTNYFNTKAFLSLLLTVMFVITAVPSTALSTNGNGMLYHTDNAFGIVFYDGINVDVTDNQQFNTEITNVSIFKIDNSYELSFYYCGAALAVEFDVVKAKANNINGDHYMLSPKSISDGFFDVVNISFTTCANIYDLLPVNSAMNGQCVLTIILQEKEGTDVYYWQCNMSSTSNTVFSLTEDEDAIKNANEYYYISDEAGSASTFTITQDELCSVNVNSAHDATSVNSTTDDFDHAHNPYYDIGVKDNDFKYTTNDWVWHDPSLDSNGELRPIKYCTISSTKYGSSNIWTHIMIIGYLFEVDRSITDYDSNGKRYNKVSAVIKVELYKTPHTVIYNPTSKTFELLVGGEELTQFTYPTIGLRKNSSNVDHVVVAKYAFSNGTKDNFLGLGALVLSKVLIRALEPYTHALSTEFEIASSIISNDKSVGTDDNEFAAVNHYYSDAADQRVSYGHAMGGLSVQLKGFLRYHEQYLGLRCWFATPYANRSELRKITYSFELTPEIR